LLKAAGFLLPPEVSKPYALGMDEIRKAEEFQDQITKVFGKN